ncbi:D-alanyl-D-alanine carboxypeptidase [Streptosporangium becharense]|uniref:D-alanyl-D-alanine carboxypeptidase n=1 Tax=Streptosporangium becharense TaxID=1816182 RepID=A0A7W9MEH6_9ACTN|nr:serine hydrolase domain-containing protein [Streptosporangium becharense]MBB2910654.1 D-alanyl-D-alanine carboxypeptidase [Streptosporangium becharense]MBB5817349.1 D-alanyl-D-alanine carboxypeptidase [Streptosporangium becharense]
MRPRLPHTVTASALAVSLTVAAAFPAAAAATPSAARSGAAATWGGTEAQRAQPSWLQQRAQLQRLARKLVAVGAPGVIVRVDDGRGRPVEIVAQAPWTRRDHLLKAGDEFRMGSNTKTMTATLVLQLVAEGRLALTDPVEKWLPGKVPNGGAITLRMLLNHTSGLFDYTEDAAVRPSILGTDRRRWTPAKLLAVGVKHDPLFAPGTKWSYSNTNYAAIGAVLERVTGTSLADLVRDRIVRPLGLHHTYYATDSTWRGPHAHGYEPDAARMPPGVPAEFRRFAGARHHGHVDVSANDPGWGGAAGAVVSTTRDWSRFSTALLSGKLLPAAQLAQLRTTVPVDPRQPDGPGYGLGIQTGTTPCGTFWGHDGGLPGYLTVGVADRTGGRTATVLIATESWSEFGTDPKIAKAAQALQTSVICAMFGKPVPAAAHGG